MSDDETNNDDNLTIKQFLTYCSKGKVNGVNRCLDKYEISSRVINEGFNKAIIKRRDDVIELLYMRYHEYKSKALIYIFNIRSASMLKNYLLLIKSEIIEMAEEKSTKEINIKLYKEIEDNIYDEYHQLAKIIYNLNILSHRERKAMIVGCTDTIMNESGLEFFKFLWVHEHELCKSGVVKTLTDNFAYFIGSSPYYVRGYRQYSSSSYEHMIKFAIARCPELLVETCNKWFGKYSVEYGPFYDWSRWIIDNGVYRDSFEFNLNKYLPKDLIPIAVGYFCT